MTDDEKASWTEAGPRRPEMMLISNLASYLLAAVLAVGIVLTVARWQRRPRVSLLVVIALGLPLLLDFGLTYAQRIQAVWGWLQRMTPAQRRLIFTVHQALGQTSRAASYVLFLVAAFGRPDDERFESDLPAFCRSGGVGEGSPLTGSARSNPGFLLQTVSHREPHVTDALFRQLRDILASSARHSRRPTADSWRLTAPVRSVPLPFRFT
jgi:hypothetical protein